MGEVLDFAASRPVMRRRMEEDYRRLMRLFWSFYLRGDSYHAKADELCTAAGLHFNVYRLPEGAPEEARRLSAIGWRYCNKAHSFENRAEHLERRLWPARHVFNKPNGAA